VALGWSVNPHRIHVVAACCVRGYGLLPNFILVLADVSLRQAMTQDLRQFADTIERWPSIFIFFPLPTSASFWTFGGLALKSGFVQDMVMKYRYLLDALSSDESPPGLTKVARKMSQKQHTSIEASLDDMDVVPIANSVTSNYDSHDVPCASYATRLNLAHARADLSFRHRRDRRSFLCREQRFHRLSYDAGCRRCPSTNAMQHHITSHQT